MQMSSISSETFVPFFLPDLEHQLHNALDALAEADGSRTGLVEHFVATNIVAFFRNA